MTSRGKDQLDDEFEAFLAGRGELARQLSALPQPESPALLNDAIIASIKAEMAQEKAAQQQARPAAANDAGVAGASAPPPAFRPAFMTRWRMPMAMAASVIGAVLLMLEWQREEGAPLPPPSLEMRQPAPVAAESVPASEREPAQAAAATDAQAAAPRPAPAPPPAAAPGADQAGADAARPARTAESAKMDARALAKPAAPAMAETVAKALADNAPAPAATYERAAPVAAYGAPPAPIVMPAPAPAVMAMRAVAPANPKAAAWLNLIDEMLKADLRKDALAEWEKFRLAYPDYPVPDTLAQRIAAIK